MMIKEEITQLRGEKKKMSVCRSVEWLMAHARVFFGSDRKCVTWPSLVWFRFTLLSTLVKLVHIEITENEIEFLIRDLQRIRFNQFEYISN